MTKAMCCRERKSPRQIYFGSGLLALTVGGAIAVGGNSAIAQIVPDNTLGAESSIVAPIEPGTDSISGGAIRGHNLFHSFREFNIDAGRAAYFSNPAGIENILTRVTGGNPSNLNGLLGVLGNANLFLINPNGIVFGPGARLDLRGSFLASTADRLIFENGFEFGAAASSAPPLLTVNLPIGLQLSENPGAISISGQSTNLAVEDPIFSPFSNAGSSEGLRVDPGQNLTLVGGDINIAGSALTAPGGRIELGSVKNGAIAINPAPAGWTLSYDEALSFGDILLDARAAADASGLGNGSIQVRSRLLGLHNGSVILIQNQGAEPAGNISINTSESVEVSGTSPDATIRSGLTNETVGGLGGDIIVSTGQLVVRDGATIAAKTYSPAPGGEVNLNASESILVLGASALNPAVTTAIVAASFGSGKAGDNIVSTGRLTASGGGTIVSSTVGSGDSGSLQIKTDESIEIIGVEPNTLVPSGLSVATLGDGRAGSLTIETGSLTIRNGGRVDASTAAAGDAGSLTINASESVEISGTVPGSLNPSLAIAAASVFSETFRETFDLPELPSGNSGNVTINAPVLLVSNGGQVTVRNDGIGNPGQLQVNAEEVILQQGGITAITTAGEGGNIEVNAREVLVNQGIINASTMGEGRGGSITIRADRGAIVTGIGLAALQENAIEPVSLGTSILSNSSAGIVSNSSGAGRAGDITIETPRLAIANAGLVTTSSLGAGAAGNLLFQIGESLEVNGSFIAAGTLGSGQGGSIELESRRLQVADGALIGAFTLGSGNAGSLTIRVTDAIEMSGNDPDNFLFQDIGPGATTSVLRGATGNGGNLTIETRRLVLTDGGEISSGSFGAGNAGFLSVRATDSIELSGTSALGFPSLIYVDSLGSGNGGNARIETSRLLLRDGAQISAGAFEGGRGGSLVIRASDLIEAVGSAPAVSEDLFLDESGRRFPSGLFARSPGLGNAGDLTIETRQLIVSEGAQISVGSQNAGLAGNLDILSRNIRLENGTIDADSVEGDGGNIKIATANIQLRRGSAISTNAQGTATGGNIIMNASILAALENSDISANAEQSFGGRVTVNAEGIFGTEFRTAPTPKSDITATSQLGAAFSGIVQISTPEVDPGSGLVQLPENIIDLEAQLAADPCKQGSESEFTITGRGGLPLNPVDPLSSYATVIEWAMPSPTPALGGVYPLEETRFIAPSQRGLGDRKYSAIDDGRSTLAPGQIVEAQGWVVDVNGDIILTATPQNAIPHRSGFPEQESCGIK